MRYQDCLLLDDQKKVSMVVSGSESRNILLFRHVLELAQVRSRDPLAQLFSNVDIPDHHPLVPMIGCGARQRVRNVLI